MRSSLQSRTGSITLQNALVDCHDAFAMLHGAGGAGFILPGPGLQAEACSTFTYQISHDRPLARRRWRIAVSAWWLAIATRRLPVALRYGR